MNNVLHVYAQKQWHDEAFLVGDRDGLVKLRDAISEALEKGTASTLTFAADGEGYRVHVVTHPQERMERLRLPYATNAGGLRSVGRYPSSLVKYRADAEILDDDEWFARQRALGFNFEHGEDD